MAGSFSSRRNLSWRSAANTDGDHIAIPARAGIQKMFSPQLYVVGFIFSISLAARGEGHLTSRIENQLTNLCSVENLNKLPILNLRIFLDCCIQSRMSTTTKSPKKLARAAYRIAQNTLPDYSHRFSPKKFTQPQLFVCLVLKTFLKTDYRGIVDILKDCSDLAETLQFKTIPHYTTVQKAARRLLNKDSTQEMLARTISVVVGKQKRIELAALDATGIESGHISPYFLKRRSDGQKPKRNTQLTRWPKLAAVADVATHLILAVHPCRGPGRDISHFKKILNTLPKQVVVKQLLADAGYDAEYAHQYARETKNIKTTIPALIGKRARGLPKTYYRRQMKVDFDTQNYHQRWQIETVFSMVKRNLGHSVFGRNYCSQCRDIMLLVLTHNIMIILLCQRAFLQSMNWLIG
jgi:hypothetical protein